MESLRKIFTTSMRQAFKWELLQPQRSSHEQGKEFIRRRSAQWSLSQEIGHLSRLLKESMLQVGHCRLWSSSRARCTSQLGIKLESLTIGSLVSVKTAGQMMILGIIGS